MAAADASGLLDSPTFVSIALPRRRARRGASRVRAVDDDYEVGGGIKISLRTYPHAERPESRPLVLMWHGNGEVAADYDDLSSTFHDFGVNLTVVDFRGYGWGTDTGPLLTTVASDASALLPALDAILVRAGLAPEVRPSPSVSSFSFSSSPFFFSLRSPVLLFSFDLSRPSSSMLFSFSSSSSLRSSSCSFSSLLPGRTRSLRTVARWAAWRRSRLRLVLRVGSRA